MLAGVAAHAQSQVFVEAENFSSKGGWQVDQQFMDIMGSPYLIAHGMGIPVSDASTVLKLEKGVWHVWVRTYNWTSPWTSEKGPGSFVVKVDGKSLGRELGCTGSSWEWQYAGCAKVRKSKTTLSLSDLSGFDGRCDAIFLSKDENVSLPADVKGNNELRRSMNPVLSSTRNYDFVVVGGGIAGMCAAVTAARSGLKVALVNDRPILGGNNSSEIRVHLGGHVELGPYNRLGRMQREFGHTRKGNANPAEYYEDEAKQRFIDAEENIDLLAPYHAFAVETSNDRIVSVTIKHIENGEEIILQAPIFSDCTGDGTIGYLAGADWTQGREAKSEFNERSAPEVADQLVMGASVQWYSKEDKTETSFPEFSYGVTFDSTNAQKVTMGEWTWETGMNRDQVWEAERVRDYGLLVVYSNWSALKNHVEKEKYARRSLDWVAYVAGKRESRRLLGDHILDQNDIDKAIHYDDATCTTSWSIDLHFPDKKNTQLFPENEFKSATVHDWIFPYEIPYRCFYSRNISNLFMAGRNISCTHIGLGTVRVMRTTGMMGEVVGMAAKICNEKSCDPRAVYTDYLPELKAAMKKGAAKEGVELNNQKFNLANKFLPKPKAYVDADPEHASTSCYAVLDGETLHLGNSLIHRSFKWNGGNLITLAIEDKTTGREFRNKADAPDFVVSETPSEASDGNLEVTLVPSDGIRPAHMLAVVSYRYGDYEIRREWRIYENCPALAVDNFVRSLSGKAAGLSKNASDNVADHKNIESKEDMQQGRKQSLRLDLFVPGGDHWHAKAVEFSDVTDWNNNLVKTVDFIPYRKLGYRGNLLFARDTDGNGLFFLKEAPCSSVQLAYPGKDFEVEAGSFAVVGLGAEASDLAGGEWVKLYSCVTGAYGVGELAALQALRCYQKQIRVHMEGRDEMVMMNTWGDRSQDAKVNESFCIQELEKAARLGITHFQIDDGWQEGKSPNSAVAKGSFKNIHDNPLYWTPARDKYPHGLAPVVAKAKELGIELGLWFNPSVQNDFEDWEKDVEAVVRLYEEYGIKVFKIDGLAVPTKKAEANLRKFFDGVLEKTANQVVFNLDATAGRRGGYHMFNEYGNTFLENRYTDWRNYYPYWTLRNLWQLSPYVPAERLQIEFLNKWRNAERYEGCEFAPQSYDFSYIFATSMAGQPLAWMEASNLPEEAYDCAQLIKDYVSLAPEFHEGTILPIGNEPSGRSWTGFQSVNGNKGFVLVFREDNEDESQDLKTWFPQSAKVNFTCVLGCGSDFSSSASKDGSITFSLPRKNSFAMYRYQIDK
ncbi:MAG: FAD-dependent oxidoreductase [Bacteroidales bacterium]|nr:FAD-dependent oxidoreductase [Bacteroidales bacterium]